MVHDQHTIITGTVMSTGRLLPSSSAERPDRIENIAHLDKHWLLY
jgi:hypothetical protein